MERTPVDLKLAPPPNWEYKESNVNFRPVGGARRSDPAAWKVFRGGDQQWLAGSGCNCLADIPECLLGCCCPCISLCNSAALLKQENGGIAEPMGTMFECPSQCLALLTTMGPYGTGYCIGMCVCPELTCAGCYTTSLIRMTMHKYNLVYPDPCGPGECCCGPYCLCSGYWCSPCMLVHVARELKMRSSKGPGM